MIADDVTIDWGSLSTMSFRFQVRPLLRWRLGRYWRVSAGRHRCRHHAYGQAARAPDWGFFLLSIFITTNYERASKFGHATPLRFLTPSNAAMPARWMTMRSLFPTNYIYRIWPQEATGFSMIIYRGLTLRYYGILQQWAFALAPPICFTDLLMLARHACFRKASKQPTSR